MADIFSHGDARKLLDKKFILMLGDSNIRILYKDLLVLLNNNEMTTEDNLRTRGETNFKGDHRIRYFGRIKGDKYVEDRDFRSQGIHIQFHFITKCYNEHIENVLRKIKHGTLETPAVIVMNSSIWDMSNYGNNYVEGFKMNMQKLMNLLNECLTDETIFIWISAVPVSSKICMKSFNDNKDFQPHKMMYDLMEANTFSRNLVVTNGHDFLDVHYYLIRQQHRRKEDGLHFNAFVMRYVTNLFLTHIALSWNEKLPSRVTKGIALSRSIGRFQNDEFIKPPEIDPATIPACPCTEVPQRRISPREQSQQPKQIPALITSNTRPRNRYQNGSVQPLSQFEVPVRTSHNQWFPPQRFNFHQFPPNRHSTNFFPRWQGYSNNYYRPVGPMNTFKRTPNGRFEPYGRRMPRLA